MCHAIVLCMLCTRKARHRHHLRNIGKPEYTKETNPERVASPRRKGGRQFCLMIRGTKLKAKTNTSTKNQSKTTTTDNRSEQGLRGRSPRWFKWLTSNSTYLLCLSPGFEPQVGRTFGFICKNKNKKGFNC